jgi:TolB-like protein
VLIKKAIRLNPHHPPWYLWFAGEVFWDAKRYDEAVPVFKKYIELTNAIWGYLFLIDVYIHLNREKEAQQIANEVVKKYPDFSIEKYVDPVVFDKQEDKRIIINSLQKVGLPEHRPLKLPDKPSIAVLPFDNLSDDPEQEYFSDGMTDDLITDLSKISGLFVIARNSAFQYKGKAVDVKRISQELGIRYVLEGSVRRAKDRVRINAQLIDATTGGHLWAERYDGQMDDIFSLQDKITQKIVAALAVRLTAGEQKSLTSKGTENIEAYDAFLKGWQHYIRFTPADFTAAITSFKKAIELDPNYGRAYAAMALMYFSGARVSKEMNKALGADFVEARLKARHYLNTAMKKPTDLAYKVSSLMDLKLRRHDEALHNIEKAIAINPNDADTQLTLAEVLIFIGRPKEAIDVIKKVMQLDPTRMDYCLLRLGLAHFCLEQYDEVVDSLERALRYNPTLKSDLDPLFATTYAHLGREAEAEAALEEYMKWWSENAELKNLEIGIPDLRHYVWDFPFKDPKITKRFVDGLIKAGWHEPHRYWEVYKENKLTGDEIRDLVFGRKCVGVSRGDIWTAKYDNEGNVFFEGYGLTDTGKAWIEGDQFCEKWKKFKGGLSGCADVYRNPTGTPEGKDEYFTAWDWNAISYSFVD